MLPARVVVGCPTLALSDEVMAYGLSQPSDGYLGLGKM